VPSFRFNKADDLMVEVTPTSSFEELEEPVTLVNIGSVQDTSSTLNYSTTEHTDPFLRTLIPSGPQSVIKYDDIDEYYGTGDGGKKNDYSKIDNKMGHKRLIATNLIFYFSRS
jgi:hypothetical protein